VSHAKVSTVMTTDVASVRPDTSFHELTQLLAERKVSAVPGLGSVAVEIIPGGPSTLIVKHRDDVVPDRAAIEAAVRKAGDYWVT